MLQLVLAKTDEAILREHSSVLANNAYAARGGCLLCATCVGSAAPALHGENTAYVAPTGCALHARSLSGKLTKRCVQDELPMRRALGSMLPMRHGRLPDAPFMREVCQVNCLSAVFKMN